MKNAKTLRWTNWTIPKKIDRPGWSRLRWAPWRRQLEMKWKELIRQNRRR